MKQIKLSNCNSVVLVDDEDFEELNQYKWYARKSAYLTYAARGYRVDGKVVIIKMHRFILGVTSKSIEVHHKDNNTFNNQGYNLEACTKQYNLAQKIRAGLVCPARR